MLLKICRLRDPENIADLALLRPHYMGFDFVMSRSSYMGEVDEAVLSNIPRTIRRVGLFCDQSPVEIASIAGRFGLNSVQLDGNESASQCEEIAAEGLEVIKTIYVSGRESLARVAQYDGVCNKVLLKLSATLPIDVLERYDHATPFLLSLRLDNIDIESLPCHARMCGIDTGSSFETAPAIKDMARLVRFFNSIRSL